MSTSVVAGVHWSHVARDSLSDIAAGVTYGRTSVTTRAVPPGDGVATRVPVPVFYHSRLVDFVARDRSYRLPVDRGRAG